MSSKTNPSHPPSPELACGDKDRPNLLPQSDYPSLDVKPIAPLPPIRVDKHPAPFDTDPMASINPPSPELDDSEEDLAALVHPDMPFNTVADLNAPHAPLHTQPIPPSPVQRNKIHRASTAGSSTLSDQTRDAVSEMMSMFTSTAPPRKRYAASQIAQWRAEEAYYKGKIQEELGGKEICLIRYEPRQGWLGFWNKENVLDIIDDLRALRPPKS